MFNRIFLLLSIQVIISSGYMHSVPKDNYFVNVIMSEILNRMSNNINHGETYADPMSEISTSLSLTPRTYNPNANNDFYYEGLYADVSNPSLRDQEFLQHSSLWGHHLLGEDMDEGHNQMKPPPLKSDVNLPAYCNPPNPCPYGYSESRGCIIDFDNTAIFSREFQASQQCICDSEHMFDCASKDKKSHDMTADIENFLAQKFQPSIEIKNKDFISKKYHSSIPNLNNPFLKGAQLPIAAKKGNMVN